MIDINKKFSIINVKKISITFKELLAEALGYNANEEYVIFTTLSKEYNRYDLNQYAPRPPRKDGGVNNILIYSDISERINYGSQLTNIIDVLPTEGGTMKIKTIFYKKLRPLREINDVSIMLRDQRGKPILFADGSDVLVVLHIRETLSNAI